jgi:thioredoxin 1
MNMTRLILLALLLLWSGCSTEKGEQKENPMLHVTSYEAVDPKIGQGKPMLLELGSTTCSGCKDMAKSLYYIKNKFPESEIYFIDIKRERYVARQYGVRMMPTQVILDGQGNVVDTHVGAAGTSELIERLKRFGVISGK